MKKQLFLLSLLGAMMAGCSSEDIVKDNDGLPEGYTNSYLSVSVIGANAAGTRATYDKDDETYEDGTEKENNVSTVRFFFFDEERKPAMVYKTTDGNYRSYMDMDNQSTGGPNHGETVEKIVETTLRLNIPDGSKNPRMVLAVINPTADIIGLSNPSLDKLKECIRNFKIDGTKELTENNFVMSNSVYADDEGKVFGAEILKDENFQTTNEAANARPVKIYVERVLARLDFSLDEIENESRQLEDGSFIYKLNVPDGYDKDKYLVDDGKAETPTPEDIYVKFIGWDITGTPIESRLIKEVDGTWPSDLLGESVRWTTDNYHRSFWALNPNLGEAPTDAKSNKKYKFVSFNGAKLEIPSGEGSTTTYLQENANGYSTDKDPAMPDYATKVFITAQLVNEKGTPKQLAEWMKGYYTVDGVKIAMLKLLQDLYTENGENGYRKVNVDDLEFAQSKIAGAKSYQAQATIVGEGKKWYQKVGDDYKELEDVNQYIYDTLGYALVWETGETYYFFDIRHLGEASSVGYNGVVRNHIYKTFVTSVSGLGTPVYDPDEEIFPEIPKKENIIAAKVNILSWRVVRQTYDLTW